MKMEQTECSETSAYKIQTPGNYLKESIKLTDECLEVLYSIYSQIFQVFVGLVMGKVELERLYFHVLVFLPCK